MDYESDWSLERSISSLDLLAACRSDLLVTHQRPADAAGLLDSNRGGDDENAADEWRAYRDVDDDLPVFCPECAEREFGDA